MWIFLRIAIGMMHAVHNGVRSGIQERGALGEKRQDIKKMLPEFRHGKHAVRRVTMQEKRLAKEG